MPGSPQDLFHIVFAPEANENRPMPISDIIISITLYNVFHKEAEEFIPKMNAYLAGEGPWPFEPEETGIDLSKGYIIPSEEEAFSPEALQSMS